jgi:lipopolysaccharide transport system ATP-binding protein
MSEAILTVENLGKRYRIGGRRARYLTLREGLMESAATFWGRAKRGFLPGGPGGPGGPEAFWALRDATFEVRRGEVVGIVGRNGAGKSTLLKILSRITKPTEGRALLRGRVGSLLEVGTGFHPELTGRENIFLSGAVLGMKRSEIVRQFDAIVDFAEVDRFLDTPIKHYSSGMHVRLGFAVAAHLDPEILMIDEVLAVGDAAFQKKCLGKMNEVAKGGRTILFVSHNMAAVAGLCTRAILVESGRLTADGSAEDVIRRYVEAGGRASAIRLAERSDRSGSGNVLLTRLEFCGADGNPVASARLGEPLLVALDYEARLAGAQRGLDFEVGFYNLLGERVFLCGSAFAGSAGEDLPSQGRVWCSIPELPLMPGVYSVNVFCGSLGLAADWVKDAAQLHVIEGDFFGTGKLPPGNAGIVAVRHAWRAGSPPSVRR